LKNILFLVVLFFSINAIGQDLTCSDFKEGTLYAEISEPFKLKWKITREDNTQIEEIIEIPVEIVEMGYPMNPRYEIIKWLDDCSYVLMYDESKSELTEIQININKNGGVLTTVTNIEGKCFNYTSRLVADGLEKTLEGKLCKE